jgi:hypothetical protein
MAEFGWDCACVAPGMRITLTCGQERMTYVIPSGSSAMAHQVISARTAGWFRHVVDVVPGETSALLYVLTCNGCGLLLSVHNVLREAFDELLGRHQDDDDP